MKKVGASNGYKVLLLLMLSVCMVFGAFSLAQATETTGVAGDTAGTDAGAAAAEVDTTPIATLDTSITRYCKEQLKLEENSARLIKLYDMIRDGVNQQLAEITVDVDSHPNTEDDYTVEEASKIYNLVMEDYPELFWMTGQYRYGYYEDTNIATQIVPTYLFDTKEDTQTANATFEAKVKQVLAAIQSEKNYVAFSDYAKELWIHDYIAKNCVYDDLNATYAHSAYGMLVDGNAVCEGYTRAFQYLLNKLGVECTTITGADKAEATEQNHIWNAVKLGGKWYQVDVTWDDHGDTDAEIFYVYFNITSDMMYKDHKAIGNYVDVPECTATDYWYYTVNSEHALTLSSYSTEADADYEKLAAKIAGYIKNYGYARLYILDTDKSTNDLIELYTKEVYTEEDSANVYTYDLIGLIIKKLHADTTKACSYVPAGIQKEQILSITYTPSESSQSSDPRGAYLLGDVDCNGEIGLVDALYLERYVAEWETYKANSNFYAADLNGSNTIDIDDIMILERYIANKSKYNSIEECAEEYTATQKAA